MYLSSLMPRLYCIFHLYYPTIRIRSYCFAPKYFGEIKTSSVILSTSPRSSSVYIIRSETITPSKLSHLAEKMAKISCSNPGDGSRSVVSRSEWYYQLLEKKRSIAATPPWIVTKVGQDKKLATTINDDVFSPLSTATQATSPAIPWMEWAHIKERLGTYSWRQWWGGQQQQWWR